MLKSYQELILIIKDYYGFLSLTWLGAVLAPLGTVLGCSGLRSWGDGVLGCEGLTCKTKLLTSVL